jgi:hypothetical protein
MDSHVWTNSRFIYVSRIKSSTDYNIVFPRTAVPTNTIKKVPLNSLCLWYIHGLFYYESRLLDTDAISQIPNVNMSMRPNTYGQILLQCVICGLVSPLVTENRLIKIESDQEKFGLSSKQISSQSSLKLPDSKHAYAEVRVIQTAYAYLSVALWSIHINEAMRIRITDYITVAYALY